MAKGTSIARFPAGALLLLACASLAWAGEPPALNPAVVTPSQEEIKKALRVALTNGVKCAIAKLGKEDGFFKDPAVKIPVPAHLEPADTAATTIKQDLAADRLVRLMNRTSEAAVVGTADVLAEAIAELAFDGEDEILKGPADAATQYLKRTCSDSLEKRLLPVVKPAARDVGAADEYRVLAKRALRSVRKPPPGSFDLNTYVTRKMLDGLFVKIAEEEKRIRDDPAGQNSEILKKVFGAAAKRE